VRVHIHSDPLDGNPRATLHHWHEAVSRAGDIAAEATVSSSDTQEGLASALASVEVLITTGRVVKSLNWPDLPKLKLIFLTHAGVDILRTVRVPPHVRILNNSGAHAEKASEYAMMAVLMLANLIPAFIHQQRQEVWNRRLATSLPGRRGTIVGLGAIGSAIAQKMKVFGMHVTGVRTRSDPHQFCDDVLAARDLDTALPRTEFLIMACPLTLATRHLLDERRLALLPKDAGVVNIGRGELVDQDALLDGLDSGHLSGAVLDVFTPEPVPPGHRLWRTSNLVMTPHMSAGDPIKYIPRSLDILLHNLKCFRDGEELPNQVDLSRGY
jgi:phosphoglycerate dehydrogenase-like enzyme